MAGHRLASDRAGDVSGRPRSDPDILQAHVPPDRSTRIETVCRPPDRTTGRTSSGHYPFCGTIYRVAETCLHWLSLLSFVAKRDAGNTKPVKVKVRDGLSPAPAFAHPASRWFQSTRIKTAHFHGSAMPYRSLCADIILSGITFPFFYFFLSAAATSVAAGTIMFSWAFLPGEPFWVRAYHWQAGLYGLLDLTERAAKGYSIGFGIKISRPPCVGSYFYVEARTSLFFRHTPCRCQATHTTTLSLDAWFKKKLPPIWKPQENIKILSQGKLANPPIYTA